MDSSKYFNSKDFADIEFWFSYRKEPIYGHKVILSISGENLTSVLKEFQTDGNDEISHELKKGLPEADIDADTETDSNDRQNMFQFQLYSMIEVKNSIARINMNEYEELALVLFLKYIYTGSFDFKNQIDNIESVLAISELFGNNQFTNELLKYIPPEYATFENALNILLNGNSSQSLINQAIILLEQKSNMILSIESFSENERLIKDNLALFIKIIKNQHSFTMLEDEILILLLQLPKIINLPKEDVPEFYKNIFDGIRWEGITFKCLEQFYIYDFGDSGQLEILLRNKLKGQVQNIKENDVSCLYRSEYFSIEDKVSKVSHSFEDFVIENGQFTGTIEAGRTDGSVLVVLKEPQRIGKITTKSDKKLNILVQASNDGEQYEVLSVGQQYGTWPARCYSMYWKIVIKKDGEGEDSEDEEEINFKFSFSLFTKKLYSKEEISDDKIDTLSQTIIDNMLKTKKKVTFDLKKNQIKMLVKSERRKINKQIRKKTDKYKIFKIDHVERNLVIPLCIDEFIQEVV